MKSTPFWKSAWVPTRMSTSPAANAANVLSRARPVSRPVSRARETPLPSNRAPSVSACWFASSSVGTISAACAADLHRDQHGEQRDHGLAAADIALEQPEHPAFLREVLGDFGGNGALAFGQVEGERCFNFGAKFAVAGDGAAAPASAERRTSASASWFASSSS